MHMAHSGSRVTMTPEELEVRRVKAAKLFSRGVTQYVVAKRFSVSTAAVNYWHKAWEKKGKKALFKKDVGPKGKLTKEKIAKVERALLKGPEAFGYNSQLWTLPRITEIVRKVTQAAYRDRSIWHVLLRMGWSCQKPTRKAKERDEKAIARWKKVEWPSIKKRGFAEA